MNPCAVDNGNCSHLCLLSSDTPEGFACACPDRLALDENQRDCFSEYLKEVFGIVVAWTVVVAIERP